MVKVSMTGRARRNVGIGFAGLAVAGALLIPGIAWANDPVPNAAPTPVSVAAEANTGVVAPVEDGSPFDGEEGKHITCDPSDTRIFDSEELQTLIDNGEAVPAIPATPGESGSEPGQRMPLSDSDQATPVTTSGDACQFH